MTTELDSSSKMLQSNGISNGLQDFNNQAKFDTPMTNSNQSNDPVSVPNSINKLPPSYTRLSLETNKPPTIPHVQINQTSLSLIIRNLTVFTIKEISQYMKTNLHNTMDNSKTTKKINFLNLIIFLRNQFLKLYVLIKWSRTIKNNNFHILIDLLNWFRTTNMSVNNCIWSLKSSLESMTNAKLPNVDLITALEVLSLGRPNLQTFKILKNDNLNYVNGMIEIPSNLIISKLNDLNLVNSIKISMMEVPPQFNNYNVKNGKIYITVPGEFEIQLSTVDHQSNLFFVDLTLLLNSSSETKESNDETTSDTGNNNSNDTSNMENNDDNKSSSPGNKIISKNFDNSLPLNKQRLEKVINEILFKSSKPLFSLYQFLHKYILTLKLYMIHMELLNLETLGKYSGGNLIHSYDSKKSIINGRYWINGKTGNKGKFTIGVAKSTETLVLRWDNYNEISTQDKTPSIYPDLLNNIENILDEIMFNHANLIRLDLLSKKVFQEDEDNLDVLLFQLPTTCQSTAPVQLKIDLITGVFYFKNPTPLLLEYTQQINRAETTTDLLKILQKLKLDKITQILNNMFEKTGWICSKAIKLSKSITTDIKVNNRTKNNEDDDRILQRDMFVSLPKWPIKWYLVLSIISSDSSCIIEKRIGKIVSNKGNWELKYLDPKSIHSSKMESITYQKIMPLQKSILHRIINHMLIDSLNQLNIHNKVCSTEVINSVLPKYIVEDLQKDSSDDSSEEYTSVIALELQSFLEGSKALNGILENSMFLRIDYKNSLIRLYAKFKKDKMIKQVQCEELLTHFIEDNSLDFYLNETFKNLGEIVKYLTTFRQKLMQLVVVTDVVDKLHKNFSSEFFKITELKPNEISFKYLKDQDTNDDKQDCTINIITSEQMVKNLTFKLSESNPQHVIQPFINNSSLDYHFIFNYLQFTSSFFITLSKIINETQQNTVKHSPTVRLGLHNLSEYQLIYYNPESGTKLTLIIELKNVSHNSRSKIHYFIHFSEDEHITTKSLAYPMIHQVSNQIFTLDANAQAKSRYPFAIRLIDGISCDSRDIENILSDIHEILKVDSDKKNNTN
ncbi:hypothetical protein KAFR_0D00890 [Kazachstania africana CBS 2517]|uniref:Mediator of RNA polymerase II transcription subunit 14 n=1 Tax=Kazachstania africana (strain ATCC 22294 / BCRC 22015 / CBS 2517 / CECT 1963 / NBRC 1671 / NRRL Y-8276) TaxID=1071382 RepID=H2ATN6_KAZAF|nr:hypothetical protein KAFR_0D00890 [Kazachstania africana CBS 2517]CCF57736.1 hypothetical protein KAFR_0D00890 [Kazachstania africana CBS 2517]